ncbi:hypothetical protein GCM10007082_21830 [Oceanisphaera arctica]|nr:hypothetical protein GCM10007082_21830 [Oceanisphaera arctica]
MLDSRARPETILLLSCGADKNGYAQQMIKNEEKWKEPANWKSRLTAGTICSHPSLMMTSFDELDG